MVDLLVGEEEGVEALGVELDGVVVDVFVAHEGDEVLHDVDAGFCSGFFEEVVDFAEVVSGDTANSLF